MQITSTQALLALIIFLPLAYLLARNAQSVGQKKGEAVANERWSANRDRVRQQLTQVAREFDMAGRPQYAAVVLYVDGIVCNHGQLTADPATFLLNEHEDTAEHNSRDARLYQATRELQQARAALQGVVEVLREMDREVGQLRDVDRRFGSFAARISGLVHSFE